MPHWAVYVALFAAGLAASALNVVAGGGSFLTLPVLIFLGMPASVANGTNRVGIWLQNAGAVWGFQRHGVLSWRWAAWAAVPATAGAGLGTWIALEIGDQTFQRVLAFLMVAISLWTLADPFGKRAKRAEPLDAPPPGRRRWAIAAGFFLVGIYGGFVQAGVGFLVLAVTTLGGLDLVRGNAVKVLTILAFTTLSLAIFASQGRVEWVPGLVLAAGSLAGGLLGVRLTVLKGERWIKAVVTVAVIGFAIKLWLD